MSDTTTVHVRLPNDVKGELDALARRTGRSASHLAAEAIAGYVALDRWQVEGIHEALAEADSGDPGIPHEVVARWLDSWGTENELPPPDATS